MATRKVTGIAGYRRRTSLETAYRRGRDSRILSRSMLEPGVVDGEGRC
jgi:hypothetical protein